MATTIGAWKEIFIKKYKESGFNFFGYFDDQYEVLIKQKLSDDNETTWFNGYVQFKVPLKNRYEFESFRHKNIIGCDTSDHSSKSEPEHLFILRNRITAMIKEHHKNN